MDLISKKELKQIKGGVNFTGALMEAIKEIMGLLFDAGQSLGSSIRRIGEAEMCPIPSSRVNI